MEKIENRTSESLAAIIVAHRSLGLFKEQARAAMIELMRRKDNGDDFEFDSYINTKLEMIPKSENDNPISKVLKTFSLRGF